MPTPPVSSASWLNASAIGDDELLRESRRGSLFAVLDSCGSPEVLAQVSSLGIDRACCLYKGSAANNFAEQAPYLVQVDEERLRWILRDLSGRPWGIFVHAQAPFAEVFSHLRKFLTVDSPAGERWLFRYYDPRILRAFLPVCTVGELEDFFGQFAAFSVFSQAEGGQRFQRPSSGYLKAVSPWPVGKRFRMRESHVVAFQPLVNQHVPERLLKLLREQGHTVWRESSTGDLVGHDALNHQTRISFGPGFLPQKLVTPAGSIYGLENDSKGRLRTVVLPDGERFELGRDVRDRLISASHVGVSTYQFSYDEQDRLQSILHPDGIKEEWEYAEGGRVTEWRERSGAVRRYGYDAKGQLQCSIDPLGRRTLLDFDDQSNLASISYPDGSQEFFSYDPIERTAVMTGRDGKPVLRRLDERANIREICWADGTTVRLETDELGRLLAISNPHARTEYGYDASGRLEYERSGDTTVQHQYDEAGRLVASLAEPGPSTHYEYDADGKLLCVRAWGKTVSFEYTSTGRLERLRYGDSLQEEREYARGRRLTHARVTACSGHSLGEQRYLYDTCDRLVALFSREFETPWSERSFEYDRGGRLLAESVGQNGTVLRSVRYGHDANGNLIRDGDTLRKIGLMDEVVIHGRNPVTYDALGQATRVPGKKGDLGCQHGLDGTLQEVRANGVSWRFKYDALGRRIEATDGQRTWRYGWSGLQLIWEELVSSAEQPPLRREYLYLPGGNTPIAFHEAGRTFWLQQDTRGAVICAFDEEARLVWKASYDSFGQARVEVGEIRQPWRLAGQYEDEGTGLYYNLGRYYSPILKSYLSRDPFWFKHGATAYSYCDNDPWNRIDPYGQWAWIAAGAIIGAVVSGVMAASEGKSPLEIAAAALEGAVVGAAFAVNPWLGAGAMMAADVLHQGLENGWSNVCIACAAAKALITLAGGWILGRLAGFIGRGIVRSVGSTKLASTIGSWLPRWALRPWGLPKSLRGYLIEGHLGGKLPYGFPVIDKFSRGVATSIKSINLRAATYQNPSRLSSLLNGYVNKLANFRGASRMGQTISQSQIQSRVLEVVIPKGAVSPAQQQVINQAIQNANSRGILMKVIEIR
ncbi:hypothetical protein CYFUS_003957 [Cystobacter fuscus]|uniref:Uncharacterized protein n=1 Tax=Cystobacter fuscus TaxID=43 RepID=A0A250J4T6_9BACT|nr:DUF4123 domain-containing protein [Cystobacter fuscus]ATB38522.1 hypothetical protein CYFUS_003957 [Cystobacter fuscus]